MNTCQFHAHTLNTHVYVVTSQQAAMCERGANPIAWIISDFEPMQAAGLQDKFASTRAFPSASIKANKDRERGAACGSP
jgi:hypothetical protein